MAEFDIKHVVEDTGMSARPGFYSGRGAISCDLNSRHLEGIWAALAARVSNASAAAFVNMVADHPKLTATDFLLSLYALDRAGWVYTPITTEVTTKRLYFENEGEALGGMMSIMGGMDDRNETESIRSQFVRQHEDELTEEIKKKKDSKKRRDYNYDDIGCGFRRRW